MKTQVFYIKNFSIEETEADLDISQIPPLVRRRLGALDKFALSSMIKTYSPEIEEFVFTSKQGEITRLEKLIEQYTEMNEVSPAQFSASVHNYPVGFFTQLNKLTVPYTALSAGENSISAGLVKSIISKNSEILFTYADSIPNQRSVSIHFSKKEGEIECEFSRAGNPSAEFECLKAFLLGNCDKFESELCTIKRGRR